MNIAQIIASLEHERDRLSAAIQALKGAASNKRGRQPGRRLSAASRKRISAGMKRRWAERKKKDKAA